ncbi:aminomethyltransferase, mitochondrial [Pseudomyrmex gracilis]|uniref:aminomethyltransferase, mitochondrial n=1 Tax=Pseudomyrmex gracilis TaxID=219809 RepID=UPI000995C995|nr:aminomethyltransferase, mitochondrial [Pseudomyrmex gracilis]XP_020281381.1 aminomethyltransferase, mitochondrial [Pseudomyrmex gracilis]
MLRFGSKFVVCDNFERCVHVLNSVRDTCSLATISNVRNGRNSGSTLRSKCLIDFTVSRTTARVTRWEYCRWSSTLPFHEIRRTCLYDFHVKNQAKIVNFAGWLLPVQYQDPIAISHQHTRSHSSLFDVGHMLQTSIVGSDAGEFLESLTPSDLTSLPDGTATLTIFTNDKGGILDDLIIIKDDEDRYFLVSNASRREEDIRHILDHQQEFKNAGKSVYINFLDPLDQGLIALQGPIAATALQPIVNFDLQKLKFMNSVKTEILGTRVRISRCGYTGEDGFEISAPGKEITDIVKKILFNSDVKLAGLGARDSLRLEAGLCLYGNDINEDTTPVEAALTWLIAKRRRVEANFPGAQRILTQIKTGSTKKRIGLLLGQGPPARAGAPILTSEGERVGTVTSGGPSPTLGKPIAMGYIPTDLAQIGNGMLVEVRGKTYKATVTKMPFVKTNYYTK